MVAREIGRRVYLRSYMNCKYIRIRNQGKAIFHAQKISYFRIIALAYTAMVNDSSDKMVSARASWEGETSSHLLAFLHHLRKAPFSRRPRQGQH